MDYLPKNPAILVSSINMLLRDEEYDSLESLCYNFNTDAAQIKSYLHAPATSTATNRSSSAPSDLMSKYSFWQSLNQKIQYSKHVSFTLVFISLYHFYQLFANICVLFHQEICTSQHFLLPLQRFTLKMVAIATKIEIRVHYGNFKE